MPTDAVTRPRRAGHPAVTSAAHLPLMLALTFSTGIIDAVGYLGLDKVFTGNMTGNVVVLGMGLAGAEGLPVAGPLIALACFMVGAAASGRALRGAGTGWSRTTSLLLGTVAAAMAVVTLLAIADAGLLDRWALAATGVLGTAMGLQAGTARQVGVKDVSTVVVTSTITGLAADSRLGNRTGADPLRRGTAVALILLGATVGALLLRVGFALGVGAAAVVIAGVTAYGHGVLRRHPAEDAA